MSKRIHVMAMMSLLVLCSAAWSQDTTKAPQQERLRLVHADKLVGQNIDGRAVRQLIGNVKFVQGSAVLRCDRATEFVDFNRTILYGSVSFIDESKQLYGDRLTYLEDTDVAKVEGNVVLVDSTTTLTSESLTYFNEDERAIATTNVVISDSTERATLTGQRAEYLNETGYAKVTEHPKFTKTDSTEDGELVITGNVIEMFDDGEKITVSENVVITRGEIRATCKDLEYFRVENKIVLGDLPEAERNRDFLTGNSMSLFLEGSEIVAIHIVGDASVSTAVDSVITTDVPFDLLTGADIMVHVSEEKIDSVRVEGQATSYYHVIDEGEEKGLNKAIGDQIYLSFEDSKLRRVRISSSPSVSNGVFYPPHLKAKLEEELEDKLLKLNVGLNEKTN